MKNDTSHLSRPEETFEDLAETPLRDLWDSYVASLPEKLVKEFERLEQERKKIAEERAELNRQKTLIYEYADKQRARVQQHLGRSELLVAQVDSDLKARVSGMANDAF